MQSKTVYISLAQIMQIKTIYISLAQIMQTKTIYISLMAMWFAFCGRAVRGGAALPGLALPIWLVPSLTIAPAGAQGCPVWAVRGGAALALTSSSSLSSAATTSTSAPSISASEVNN